LVLNGIFNREIPPAFNEKLHNRVTTNTHDHDIKMKKNPENTAYAIDHSSHVLRNYNY